MPAFISPRFIFFRPRSRRQLRFLLGAFAMLLTNVPASAMAQADRPVSASADITIRPTASNFFPAPDQAIVLDDLEGGIAIQLIDAIPRNADVVGLAGAGDVDSNPLLVLDTTSLLPGNLVARPGDIVRYEDPNFSMVFDAQANGVPIGSRVDAVSLSPNGLVLSFDTTITLPGNLTVSDEDLVAWNGANYSMLLDLSSTGIARSLDVDAVHAFGGGAYAVSFDTDGSVGAVSFSDQDIVLWDGTGWSLQLATTSLATDWGPADMDALVVPEPSVTAALCVLSLFLLSLQHTSRRHSSRLREHPTAPTSAPPKRSNRRSSIVMSLALLVTTPFEAAARDGILEINSTCATLNGCFPGDTPGYPVTITEQGAYRLTSILTTGSQNTTGIVVNASQVDIDLGGFTIQGVNLPGTGYGIVAGLNVRSTRIHNGFVRNVGLDAIQLGHESIVEDLLVTRAGRDGIVVGDHGRVRFTQTFECGDDGIVAGENALLVGNIVRGNADNGVVMRTGSILQESVINNNENQGLVALGDAGETAGLGHNLITNNAGSNFDPGISLIQVIVTDPNFCAGSTGC